MEAYFVPFGSRKLLKEGVCFNIFFTSCRHHKIIKNCYCYCYRFLPLIQILKFVFQLLSSLILKLVKILILFLLMLLLLFTFENKVEVVPSRTFFNQQQKKKDYIVKNWFQLLLWSLTRTQTSRKVGEKFVTYRTFIHPSSSFFTWKNLNKLWLLSFNKLLLKNIDLLNFLNTETHLVAEFRIDNEHYCCWNIINVLLVMDECLTSAFACSFACKWKLNLFIFWVCK